MRFRHSKRTFQILSSHIFRRRWSAGVLFSVASVQTWNADGRMDVKMSTKPGNVRVSDPKTHYTADELLIFDGERSEKIYIALNGYVYDVTSASDLYKRQPDDLDTDDGYFLFAGHDVTYALARMSLDRNDIGIQEYTLNEEDKKLVLEWQQTFRRKYPIVGRFQTNEKKVGVIIEHQLHAEEQEHAKL